MQKLMGNAVYGGIVGYGSVNRSTMDEFEHRFIVDGSEKTYKIAKDDDYTVQNMLEDGASYDLKIKDGRIAEAERKAPLEKTFAPLVQGEPGKRTLKNFLATAMEPAGHTLYVYGGAWNWQDDGSSAQARSIGVPQSWVNFFDENDASYSYRTNDAASTYYPYGEYNRYYYAGADCSGYVGWAVYNMLNTEDGHAGYVLGGSKMAAAFARQGLGQRYESVGVYDFRPGDIMSMDTHVWIYLGRCGDGSSVILHSTPSKSKTGSPGGGVQLTALGSPDSRAYALVCEYMAKYPEWSERYTPICESFSNYTSFTRDTAGRFRFEIDDPYGYADMSADEILADLFKRDKDS